jgi:hypothetical protein
MTDTREILMARTHLAALKKKKAKLEEKLHEEITHPARDEQMIKSLKKQRLLLQEEIVRAQATA